MNEICFQMETYSPILTNFPILMHPCQHGLAASVVVVGSHRDLLKVRDLQKAADCGYLRTPHKWCQVSESTCKIHRQWKLPYSNLHQRKKYCKSLFRKVPQNSTEKKCSSVILLRWHRTGKKGVCPPIETCAVAHDCSQRGGQEPCTCTSISGAALHRCWSNVCWLQRDQKTMESTQHFLLINLLCPPLMYTFNHRQCFVHPRHAFCRSSTGGMQITAIPTWQTVQEEKNLHYSAILSSLIWSVTLFIGTDCRECVFPWGPIPANFSALIQLQCSPKVKPVPASPPKDAAHALLTGLSVGQDWALILLNLSGELSD